MPKPVPVISGAANHMVGGIYNQAISQDEEILVKNGSYFAVGALFDGESLGGWYWNSNNSISTLGFAYIQAETSATVMLHNLNCGTVFAHSLLFQSNSFFYAYDVSFTNLMYDGARLKGNTYGNNLKFRAVGCCAQDIPANTTKAIDGNFHRHDCLLPELV